MTSERIVNTVKDAREKAKNTIEALGIKDLLQCNKYWDNPPTPVLRDEEVLSDDDLDEEPLLSDGSETITELFQSKNTSLSLLCHNHSSMLNR